MKKLLLLATGIIVIVLLPIFFWMWQLDRLMPIQLVSAQVHSNAAIGTPAMPNAPAWIVNWHWKLRGRAVVEKTNASSTDIVLFLLGVELRKTDGTGYPVDEARLRQFMGEYVCKAPAGIPTPAAIAKHTPLATIPYYVEAVQACAAKGDVSR